MGALGIPIQELPFTKEECIDNLEDVNWEEFPLIGELDKCLDFVVSISQIQQDSSISICFETMQYDLFLWSVMTHLIDQTQGFYGHSSQSIVDGDLGIQNISFLEEIFYIFNNKKPSIIEEGESC